MSIQKESLVDIAIKRIKENITAGSWQPGDKYLSEKELIQRLGVSRTVVREALITLQSIGIIKIKAGGGVYIGNPNIDPVKEILKHHYGTHGVKVRELAEIRKVIELGALRLITEKKLDIDFEALRQLNHDYYEAIVQQGNTSQADQLFHQSLIKATANDTFYHFSEIIQEYFNLAKMDLIQHKTALIASFHEHSMMIDALQENDMVQAQNMMIKHLKPILDFTKKMEEKVKNGTNTSNGTAITETNGY